MHKAAAHKPLADAPAEPEPAEPEPASPAPDAAPDSAPAGPCPAGPCPAQPPAPSAGPQRAGPQRAARRAGQPEKKRRKTSDIDETFRLVEAALALDAPPLVPTPRSLFGMLCGVFELEFPGRLPQGAVDEALLALDAEG